LTEKPRARGSPPRIGPWLCVLPAARSRAFARQSLKGSCMAPELTSEDWAQVRYEYECTERPIPDICAEHAMSSGTLRDRVRRWNWKRRREPISREGPPPPPVAQIDHAAALPVPVTQNETALAHLPAAPQAAIAEDAETPGEGDPASIVPRLQNAVARVLPAIEATLTQLATHSHRPREMEQAGRALASLTRTLRELNALLAQHAAAAQDDDDMPKDIDAFRFELARRIDAFVESRRGEAADGAPSEATSTPTTAGETVAKSA
jgi:hypothetical protein